MKTLSLLIILISINFPSFSQCDLSIKDFETTYIKFSHFGKSPLGFSAKVKHSKLGEIYLLDNASLGLSAVKNKIGEDDVYYGVCSRLVPTYKCGNYYQKGPLDDITKSTSDELCELFSNNIFAVHKDNVDNFKNDWETDQILDSPIPEDILYYPAIGNSKFQEKYGVSLPTSNYGGLAEFVDRNNNGKYEPSLGDYPKMRGTTMYYWLFNDTGGNGQNLLGIETHVYLYVDESNPDLKFSFFADLVIVANTEHETLNDFRTGFIADISARCEEKFHNDRVGCLPKHNLGFVYSNESSDCYGNLQNSFNAMTLMKFNYENKNLNTFNLITPKRCNNYNYWDSHNLPANQNMLHNILHSKWPDGLALTFGNIGYNLPSSEYDSINYIYDHSDEPEFGYWRDNNITEECTEHQYELSKGIVAGFKGDTFKNEDIINMSFEVHGIYNHQWSNISETEITDYYYNLGKPVIDSIGNPPNITTNLIIKPNPVTDIIVVHSSEKKINQYLITSSDLNFSKQENLDAVNNVTIDVSNLNPGIYFIKLIYQDGSFESKKIIHL